MHISLGQKVVLLGVLGVFTIAFAFLFPWWLFLFAMVALAVLAFKILSL